MKSLRTVLNNLALNLVNCWELPQGQSAAIASLD
nr:MAG TPA: hypothetical protein [Caudoviricetes sp.]